MANFNSASLTKQGLALLAKVHTEQTTIEFTKAATGDGTYTNEEMLVDRVELKSQRQEFPISTITVINDSTVYLKFIVSNYHEQVKLMNGYYVKEVGIFATDPNEGEILYAIATAVQDQWDYLPAYNDLLPSTITMEFYATVANATEVMIKAGSGAYVHQEDFEAYSIELLKKITALQNPIFEDYAENTELPNIKDALENIRSEQPIEDILQYIKAFSKGMLASMDDFKTSFQDGCSTIAGAITDNGVATAENASPETMASNIGKIRDGGNVNAGAILEGLTAYADKKLIVGTMKNWSGTPNKIKNRRIANNRFEVAVDAGYHGCYWDGNSYEYMELSEIASTLGLTGNKLMPGNTICGVVSTVESKTLNWSGNNTTYAVPAGYYSGGTLDSRPSYTSGYNQGVSDADGRANANSTNYKTGYNAGSADAKKLDYTGAINFCRTLGSQIGWGSNPNISKIYTVPVGTQTTLFDLSVNAGASFNTTTDKTIAFTNNPHKHNVSYGNYALGSDYGFQNNRDIISYVNAVNGSGGKLSFTVTASQPGVVVGSVRYRDKSQTSLWYSYAFIIIFY